MPAAVALEFMDDTTADESRCAGNNSGARHDGVTFKLNFEGESDIMTLRIPLLSKLSSKI